MTENKLQNNEDFFKNNEFNQSQSMIDQCLPDYLFTDEKNAEQILDLENVSAQNNTAMIEEINENELKFTCSTPIKFYLKDEDEKAQRLNESSSPKSTHNEINRSDNSSSESEINQIEFTLSKRDTSALSNNNQIKYECAENYNYSLLEFEENEKKANSSKNSSPGSLKSNLKTPINQMENLLQNLRSNYNYKNNLSDKPSMVIPNQSLRASLEQRTITDIKLNLNKILPVNNQNDYSNQEFIENSQIKVEKQQPAPFSRKNEQLEVLESRIEHEIYRRQHCEKQIHELNQNILELQQQLAIASGLDKKRELFAHNMDVSIQKILEIWKKKESEMESNFFKISQEKQKFEMNDTKKNMKIQMLEQELNKLGNELVMEKVKSQEFINEMSNLRNEINILEKSDKEKSCKLDEIQNEVDELKRQETVLREQINKLKSEFTESKNEQKITETKLLQQIEQLKLMNQHVSKHNEKLKIDYENLMQEVKIVLEESENQYNQLVKNIETEKMTKDSLQVEINVLEEKLENTVQILKNEHNNKLNSLQKTSLEKERILIETHKNEMEKLHSKTKIELEKIKEKNFQDAKARIDDYEMKITDLNLKIDSYRNEIERLKRTNKDLENERNTIRQNLKQMLELQMKETMQLLGINNNINLNENNSSLNVNTKAEDSVSKHISPSKNFADSIEKTKANYDYKNVKEVNNSFLSPISQKIEAFHLDTLRELNAINFENKRETVFELNSSSLNAPNRLETSSPKPQIKTPKFNESNVSVINKLKQSSAPSSSIADLMSSLNYSQSFSNKLNQSLNTPPNNIQINSKKNLVENHQKIEIKDNFILDQIDIINKYYKIDDKTLAAASNLNVDKSNLSLNTSENEKSASTKKYSINNFNSKSINNSNNNANEITILNESSCFTSQTILTDNPRKLNKKENLKETSRFKMAKSMLNIFQDDETKRNMNLNDHKLNHEDNSSVLATTRFRSYSSNDQNDELSSVNNMTVNYQNNPNRASELRHFIEILLNKSPTCDKSVSQVKEDYNITPPFNSFNHKFEQLQQKFQIQNQEDLNKIFSNKLLDMNKHSTQSPLNFFANENVANDNNKSFSDSTDSFTDNNKNINKCNEKKKIPYYDHDISDLELGYTKKRSSEYYDDVKRNLNFDDDEEDETQSEIEYPEDDTEKVCTKNTNQTSNDQDIAKLTIKNQQKNFNKTKNLNSSILSNSISLNSIVNTTSSKVANQQKLIKKNNVIPPNNSNNSSQNRSMISLQMSPNQSSQQQGSGKTLNNMKDLNLIHTGNNKTTVTKTNITNLSNSNKRVWK